MKVLRVLTPLVAALAASTAESQRPPVGAPVDSTSASRPKQLSASAYALMYTGFSAVTDPASQSTWEFADAALGGGGTLSIDLGAVSLGVDAALTRTRYERRPFAGGAALGSSGNATVGTLLATGRLSSGGLSIPGIPGIPGPRGGRGRAGESRGGLFTYVALGAGVVSYWLGDVSNSDLGVAAGGGLEYGWSNGRAAFVEWKRVWGFHEREGIESAMADHTRIEVGARLPIRRGVAPSTPAG